ncbi:hypothetical protein M885DRAFT_550237 [Pelagophyceae sp. CCMP2097]|nr:hypothetical protein M885DRAFT_550237 [Pelagophyceae sp. CCMP2097]|mmetsp:Transcript_13799/g.48981  ORF Transcript_13799/g.48981 Transcript_13799/m.48981 type:complete len:246 (+) Transcript_13799:45-782(+)
MRASARGASPPRAATAPPVPASAGERVTMVLAVVPHSGRAAALEGARTVEIRAVKKLGQWALTAKLKVGSAKTFDRRASQSFERGAAADGGAAECRASLSDELHELWRRATGDSGALPLGAGCFDGARSLSVKATKTPFKKGWKWKCVSAASCPHGNYARTTDSDYADDEEAAEACAANLREEIVSAWQHLVRNDPDRRRDREEAKEDDVLIYEDNEEDGPAAATPSRTVQATASPAPRGGKRAK